MVVGYLGCCICAICSAENQIKFNTLVQLVFVSLDVSCNESCNSCNESYIRMQLNNTVNQKMPARRRRSIKCQNLRPLEDTLWACDKSITCENGLG
ncbi:hypothetical protein MHYP_G00208700 [Metynnis hypsauchen]